ncbi:hypothetical protein NSQ82_04780 [Caldifermentibacillus hisashii]|uniref:hypothetical protein n=1 Tax=Caldifermentibacillus hisashii TaxID=996558 RepID=UPI0031B6C273
MAIKVVIGEIVANLTFNAGIHRKSIEIGMIHTSKDKMTTNKALNNKENFINIILAAIVNTSNVDNNVIDCAIKFEIMITFLLPITYLNILRKPFSL